MKQKLKSGDEVDAMRTRRLHSWGRRSLKWVKRKLNKRIRKEGKHESKNLED